LGSPVEERMALGVDRAHATHEDLVQNVPASASPELAGLSVPGGRSDEC
jgi:hypothetical protein